MGQKQPGITNPLIVDWEPHHMEKHVFVNSKTREEVQQHEVILKKTEEPILKKRMTQHHNYVAKILYYEPTQVNKIGKTDLKYLVYTERLYSLCHELWIPVTSALSILKGYRRLSSTYGMMKVYPQMVKINSKKQIKVWINQNPAKHSEIYCAQNQMQMLSDIVKIIMQFDPKIGTLMTNCITLNQAINSIFHTMTQNKTSMYFNNRTKKQIKPRVSHKDTNSQSTKNNFRDTKQTEDDSLKPFNDSSMKEMLENYPNMENSKKDMPRDYLHGVNIHKSPTYININKKIESSNKNQPSGGLKKEINDSNAHYFSYSSKNNVQKQSSIQFNNTQPQPGKMIGSVRPYKPIEHRYQNCSQSVCNFNTLNGQISPTYGQSRSPEFNLISYQPRRQSNINDMERVQSSQGSLKQDKKIGKGSSLYVNQRSQVSTSREINSVVEHQNFVFHRSPTHFDNINTIYYDTSRTKTQKFYSDNQIQGVSPRIKTNFITTNTQNSKPPTFPSGHFNPSKNFNQMPFYNQISDKRSEDHFKTEIQNPKQKSNAYLEQSDTDKRQMKLKQAQRIKQQMGNLGIMNTNQLLKDKSARDLLIKQRVEQKNKKHQQLKNAITKLLSE